MPARLTQILTGDIALAFTAQIAFGSVINLLVPTLPIFLSRLGSTEVEIGVLVGVYGVASVFLRPIVGRGLVAIPERTFMIAAALLSAGTSVAYLFSSTFWTLMILRVIQGVGFAFFHTASITLIANISPDHIRAQRISYFTVALNVSAALAPPIGIFLIDRFNFTYLFTVCAGLALAALLLSTRLPVRQATTRQDTGGKGFVMNRKVLALSVVSSFAFFIWGALGAFFPLYAIQHGMANPGLFFSTVAVMMILGRTLGAGILGSCSKTRIILPCLTAYIISMAILALSQTVPMFILAAVFLGAGHGLLIPALMVYALDRSGSGSGPAMGTFTAVTDLGQFLGPLTMGLVLQHTTYPLMFACLAITGLINLNYFYFQIREKA